mgnify:CR=1 FL=1
MPKISHIPFKNNKKVKASSLGQKYDQYHETSTGKKFAMYYANWGIYARGYPPSSVPIDYVPELAYAFFDVKQNGEVVSGDAWADFEKRLVSGLNKLTVKYKIAPWLKFGHSYQSVMPDCVVCRVSAVRGQFS